MSEEKKNPWVLVLTIVKYAIVTLIGYLGGSSEILSNL